MSKTLDKLRDQSVEAKREAIKELLHQCTDEQIAKFEEMFFGPVDSIPENTLDIAIQLCERTVAKNREPFI